MRKLQHNKGYLDRANARNLPVSTASVSTAPVSIPVVPPSTAVVNIDCSGSVLFMLIKFFIDVVPKYVKMSIRYDIKQSINYRQVRI